MNHVLCDACVVAVYGRPLVAEKTCVHGLWFECIRCGAKPEKGKPNHCMDGPTLETNPYIEATP